MSKTSEKIKVFYSEKAYCVAIVSQIIEMIIYIIVFVGVDPFRAIAFGLLLPLGNFLIFSFATAVIIVFVEFSIGMLGAILDNNAMLNVVNKAIESFFHIVKTLFILSPVFLIVAIVVFGDSVLFL